MPKKRQGAPLGGLQESSTEPSGSAADSSRGVNIKADQLKLIPFYSGCPSENLNDFFLDFEEIAVMCGWSEREQILALKQKLTAAAKVFVRQQVTPIESLAQLKNLLKQQYARQQDATVLLQEFLNFTQPPNMSVAEFTNKAINMSYKAFRRGELEAHVEEANRAQVLKAMLLKNLAPQVRRGVIAANPQSVEEIINRATLEERAWKATSSDIPTVTAETPGIYTIAARETEGQNPDKVTELQKQVEMLSKKLDLLVAGRRNDSRPPACNFCRRSHFGQCREGPRRFWTNSDRYYENRRQAPGIPPRYVNRNTAENSRYSNDSARNPRPVRDSNPRLTRESQEQADIQGNARRG